MKFITFDIEARQWINVIHLGFYDGKDFRLFKTVREFLEFFLRRKFKGYRAYAHYGGRYDFLFVLDSLIRYFPQYGFRIILQGSRVLVIRVWKDSEHWYFVDSYSILPHSLKQLTQDFDVEHKKLDFAPECPEYVENDCKGLFECIESFIGFLRLKKVRFTIASQALYEFRKFRKIGIETLNEPEEELVRSAYYGGRVEIFRLEQVKGFYYDIVSLYPYVMRENFFPTGRPFQVTDYDSRRLGVYEVRVNVPLCYVPPVPIRVKGKLYFPFGSFVTYLCSPELELLKELGYSWVIVKGLVWSGREKIFSAYVDRWAQVKQEAEKESQKLIAKLMLNSLYGKFGQRRERLIVTTDCGIGTEPYCDELGLSIIREKVNADFLVPQWSAFVTSYARVNLYKLLLESQASLAYCDTDSVFCRESLRTGGAIGNLKMVLEYDKAKFILPKVYTLIKDGEEINKIKGFKLTKETFEEVLSVGTEIDFLLGFRQAVKLERVVLSLRTMRKRIKSTYDKRKVLRSGETIPYNYEELAKKLLDNGKSLV